MYCCSGCFADRFLRAFCIQKSETVGSCSFCGAENRKVLETTYLSDTFQILLDLYKTSTVGSAVFLHEQIQKDWYIFSGLVSGEKQCQLLGEICSGRISLEEKYIPRIEQITDRIAQWNEFREELKHVNRYFPKKVPAVDTLRVLFASLILPEEEEPTDIFRARINRKGKKFTMGEMGRPPVDKALNGRANPLGISYLYAASDIPTAISEVQPYKGEEVTVARIRINGKVVIADLRDPKRAVSPFELDEDGLGALYSEMPYLVTLGEELSKPIIPIEADLEYLPSQYLCEFIKSMGFGGVLYKSSLAMGYNIALFDDTMLNFVDKKEYVVVDNTIGYRELDVG
jgi:hypothetical protein